MTAETPKAFEVPRLRTVQNFNSLQKNKNDPFLAGSYSTQLAAILVALSTKMTSPGKF